MCPAEGSIIKLADGGVEQILGLPVISVFSATFWDISEVIDILKASK